MFKSSLLLDYGLTEDINDCLGMMFLIPMHNAKAQAVYESTWTSQRFEATEDLAFFFDDPSGLTLFKLTENPFHYFLIQKENRNSENFFRIFQAYDEHYTLQDWLNNTSTWSTPAKENFGNNQWLNLDGIRPFIDNLKKIITTEDEAAYFDNFGVHCDISQPLSISAHTFQKKSACTASIALINDGAAEERPHPAP
jgi:hypothetical protein